MKRLGGKKGKRVGRERGADPPCLHEGLLSKGVHWSDLLVSENSLWNCGEHDGKEQGVPLESCCRNPEEKWWWTESGTTGVGEGLVWEILGTWQLDKLQVQTAAFINPRLELSLFVTLPVILGCVTSPTGACFLCLSLLLVGAGCQPRCSLPHLFLVQSSGRAFRLDESLNLQKILYQINAFKLWWWRRLLRVPWTARRSIQSMLQEISLEYSLAGLVLKLKLKL